MSNRLWAKEGITCMRSIQGRWVRYCCMPGCCSMAAGYPPIAPLCASWPNAGTIPELLMELSARRASSGAPFELDIMLVRLPAVTEPSPSGADGRPLLERFRDTNITDACFAPGSIPDSPKEMCCWCLLKERPASDKDGRQRYLQETPGVAMVRTGAGRWTPGAARGAAAQRQRSCPLPTQPAHCPRCAQSTRTPQCRSLGALLREKAQLRTMSSNR